MDIKIKYKNIFQDLYNKDKGLLAYTLYSRYHIEPSEIVDFMIQYRNEGIIQIDEEQRIKLTTKGKILIIPLLKSVRSEPIGKEIDYIKCIQTEYRVKAFEPYLPHINFLKRYKKNERSEKETSN